MKRLISIVVLTVLCGVAVYLSHEYDCRVSVETANGSSDVDSVSSATFKIDTSSKTSSEDLHKMPEYIEDENYRWYISDGGAVIDRSYNTEAQHLDVPNELSGYPVTTLDGDVFYQHKALRSIKLPDTLKTINGAAFYRCYSLKEITIPKSVEVITNNPFFRAFSLENIYVEKGNKKFVSVDGVLFDKEMKNLISYPEGASRTEYSIPEGVEHTDFGYSVYHLRKLNIPASLKEVYECVVCYLTEYSVDSDSQLFCSVDGVLYDKVKETLLYYPMRSESTVLAIPEGVKYIDKGAFFGIGGYGTMLKEIRFPSTIDMLGPTYLWDGCENITFVGEKGSVVEQYAKDYNIKFRAVE